MSHKITRVNRISVKELKGTPIVYAWMRKGKSLYVGFSSKGFKRLFCGHHVIDPYNMLPDDYIQVWHFDTVQKARDYEEFLIRKDKPIYNVVGKTDIDVNKTLSKSFRMKELEKDDKNQRPWLYPEEEDTILT